MIGGARGPAKADYFSEAFPAAHMALAAFSAACENFMASSAFKASAALVISASTCFFISVNGF